MKAYLFMAEGKGSSRKIVACSFKTDAPSSSNTGEIPSLLRSYKLSNSNIEDDAKSIVQSYDNVVEEYDNGIILCVFCNGDR
jgi:hypothetical protein